MNNTYASRKRVEATSHTDSAEKSAAPEALRIGAAVPTGEQKGRRVDLPEAMRAKMESAFGADLSSVKLYESRAVADAGAKAVTRGSDIAFAPGMLDFSSYGGQALLGHELSHVVSQARGEVRGGGFLNDRALEARADREGAMAAAGQTVSVPAAPMSAVTAAPAAGPMQAKKDEDQFGGSVKVSDKHPLSDSQPLWKASDGGEASTNATLDAKVDAVRKQVLVNEQKLNSLSAQVNKMSGGGKGSGGKDPGKQKKGAGKQSDMDARIEAAFAKTGGFKMSLPKGGIEPLASDVMSDDSLMAGMGPSKKKKGGGDLGW